MTVVTMQKLTEQGWYLTEQGYDAVSDSGNITDVQKIIKRATDYDLREISSGEGDLKSSNIVLQIQKLRNVAAPKNNEESRAAPRMLKLSLTDGRNNFQAIEIEPISCLSLNTPPGTKLLIKAGDLPALHGIILLKSSHIVSILGGKVSNLVEKWELNKKLALHSRVRSMEEGGPPPWIPFGKKIVKVSDQDKNFKALAEKEKVSKENAEFEAQRKDAIAEAAKQGSKKVFGGGNRQLLDHGVQRIVDQGFSIEQAEYALRVNRNNVDKALRSLQRTDSKQNSNTRETREPRGKRYEKKVEEGTGKPSSGKVSLFDFLENKLPAQLEMQDDNSQRSSTVQSRDKDSNCDQYELKTTDYVQGPKAARNQRGSRSYQTAPRHVEEFKSNKRMDSTGHSSSQYPPHSVSNTSHSNKPPRFQRNQETHNYLQQDGGYKTSYTPRDHQVEPDSRNKQYYDATGRHNRVYHDGSQGLIHSEAIHKIPIDKNPQIKYQNTPVEDNNDSKKENTTNGDRREMNYNASRSANNSDGMPWIWRPGDRCKAKYWEDNRYYNAIVTAVSDRTCVVQFQNFHNFEEVLQIDCIPITDDDRQGGQGHVRDSKRQDQRLGNRQQSRYDQGHNHVNGMEFRRGGGSGGNGAKGYNKRRGQQRSTQPIYQPPAQRGNGSAQTHTQINPI
ncbi:tudor domain-containing protein 3 [Orussus abietinus]|uniref:tudor domain-containing protein 3 n=1 Tax=Orussus abietinus TaxID=222816 RepID=UPI000624F8F7|nr:tudor domain-containing protein 3 [Orussus abietinus]XP_012283530.1 tudor domain-containing protein 3 [Orussus abietinus]